MGGFQVCAFMSINKFIILSLPIKNIYLGCVKISQRVDVSYITTDFYLYSMALEYVSVISRTFN